MEKSVHEIVDKGLAYLSSSRSAVQPVPAFDRNFKSRDPADFIRS